MRVVLTQPNVRMKDGSDFAYVTALLRGRRFRGKADDVIVLPELIGEGSSTPEYLEAVSALAIGFGCHVVGGSHFADVDGRVFNQGVVVDPAGAVVTQYEKANPYGLERSFSAAAGEAGARFRIGEVECFVLVCADFWHADAYRHQDVPPEIIFVPAFSVSRKSTPDLARARWRHAMIARAFEQAAYIAVSDWAYPVGKEIRPSSGVAGLAHPDPARTSDLLRSLGRSEVRVFNIDPEAGRLLRADQKSRGFEIARMRQEQP
jgi:predicted amidohydrolase